MINYDEIDELMRPIIKILNDNNKITKFCCQGHFDKEDVYIMFDESVQEEDLLFLLELFDKHYLKSVNKPYIGENKHQFILRKWTRFVRTKFQSNWSMHIVNIKNNERKEYLNKMHKELVKYFNEVIE